MVTPMNSLLHVHSLLISLTVFACSDTAKETETGTVPTDTSTEENTEDTSTTDTATIDTDTALDTDEEPGIPFEDCLESLETEMAWFDTQSQSDTDLAGTIWFGHTHVTASEDERWAPSPPAFRDTTLLFEPTVVLDESTDLRILAKRGGETLGVLALYPPSQSPDILEQELTSSPLDPWSDSAWSVHLPWSWMEENVELHIAFEDEDGLHEHLHTLTDLGAPHRFTVSRSKIVLFGDASYDTSTYSPQKLGLDFFSVLPISELSWTDSTDWVLDEIVVRGANGPVKVSSESERLSQTSDPDRWGILKNIFTHRLNLANIGQGLTNTTFSGGNSPYSFGTTLGLGWVVNESGNYVDINNAPYSAGWTGWSAIWHGECGNVFNHEIGHSFTLAHFTEGSAANWGIDDEYPDNGVNLDSHPWGYDTVHNQFRTWYRVNSDGVVLQDSGTIQGKRDSMNGGESANTLHCFPQYTGYHAWKIQNWMESTPTLGRVDGNSDVVQWNVDTHQYESVAVDADYERPLATAAPVVTIVGAIADTSIAADANHVYPPLFWDSGNAFPLPDPNQVGLTDFEGANYVAEVTDIDGTITYALINRETVTGTDLHLFSFNLPLEQNTTQVRLLHSQTPYPNIDLSSATVLASRSFESPPSIPKSSTLGRQTLNAGHILLDSWCEAGVNCSSSDTELQWADATPISFHAPLSNEVSCSEEESVHSFEIEVINELGETAQLTLYGQRRVHSASGNWNVAMNDTTPWITHKNVRQGLSVWIPFEENTHLTEGTWRSVGSSVEVRAHSVTESTTIDTVDLDVALTVEASTLQSLNSVVESEPLSLDDSSLYFVVTDPTIGPTNREWWGSNTHTPLTIPMIDVDTGDATTITIQSYKQTCNLGWGTLWTLNSGQTADSCTYQVRLEMPDSGNEHLVSGHTYRSPGSQPIVFEGRRWHGPNANSLVGRFVWQLEYVAP